MKTKTAGLLFAGSFLLVAAPFVSAKDYQVTGPVVEVNDTMIVVEKKQGKDERWEMKKDANTKGAADLKVGDSVTIHYSMLADNIEKKAEKGKKADAKASATPKS